MKASSAAIQTLGWTLIISRIKLNAVVVELTSGIELIWKGLETEAPGYSVSTCAGLTSTPERGRLRRSPVALCCE